MGTLNPKVKARLRRKKSTRKRITGSSERPRLNVFRSAKHIYAQIIDDAQGQTLVAASSIEKDALKSDDDAKGKIGVAVSVGKLIAERAKAKKISKVVFDRNGFLYHGRIKALSDGARKSGLDF
jgi:large subunit ribosomal protein L18